MLIRMDQIKQNTRRHTPLLTIGRFAVLAMLSACAADFSHDARQAATEKAASSNCNATVVSYFNSATSEDLGDEVGGFGISGDSALCGITSGNDRWWAFSRCGTVKWRNETDRVAGKTNGDWLFLNMGRWSNRAGRVGCITGCTACP